MIQPRACWQVLLNKAQDEVQRIQTLVQQYRQRLQDLLASRERLLRLCDDYQRPDATGTVSAGMQETLNRRQFAAQLLTLLQRVDQDIAQSEHALAAARRALAEAEKELLKMQALLDQDLSKVRKQVAQREQRQLDDLGVMQFNLGPGL